MDTMENNNTRIDAARVIGITTAAALSIVWIAASTIGTEVSAPFKAFLKGAFTHHWIGKGGIAIILFFVVTFVMTLVARRSQHTNVAPALLFMLWASVFASVAIIGLYGYIDFFK
ncbi:MAG: hypothetical protein A2845_04575 [Candidatus Lloydbacteria bacterium RIFCSPHIGHO2_01_FULL_49_22]|uniref:Uncharacterized protein n=1 Tax=Candidatus Lloydbacteria bacterium RIFCSPHIGHO2_01_FULL_49_22 TaxID=1798658 RepID=A0A1G2CYL9_9BACT|nr:MAG: hypothetical protein A2845_04575 [Candidatus Lloydbacteria bacterium RIFCSPHIGHO2_01_FULL_49_22]OGZ10092.1 MAG: hypothetical protein A3C14_00610 [Candidatus Lloydbacteria bacterium RIFCSPHIGHO2_02_FULL_50_18]